MGSFSTNTSTVRHPAVAGLFYPDDGESLREMLSRLLSRVSSIELPVQPKALIVPHAGYPYSGEVAASAYALLEPYRRRISRVVVFGPAHRVYLRGIALPEAQIFATPLGQVQVDRVGRSLLLARGDVLASDAPHELEHCLEVQLPFLQTILDEFTVLPLVIGDTSPQQVESVLRDVWGGAETLLVASSDLSHYHSSAEARVLDAATADAILNRHSDLTGEQACGAGGINGLMRAARRLGLSVTEIARQNSGDTSGDTRHVVGYGAFAIHEPGQHTPS